MRQRREPRTIINELERTPPVVVTCLALETNVLQLIVAYHQDRLGALCPQDQDVREAIVTLVQYQASRAHVPKHIKRLELIVHGQCPTEFVAAAQTQLLESHARRLRGIKEVKEILST